MKRELQIVGPWVIPVGFLALMLSSLLTGCDAIDAFDEGTEPPGVHYPLTNAEPVARMVLQFYGETDMTLPPIRGVPAQVERCGARGYWDPAKKKCLMGRRNRHDGVIYLVVPPAESGIATYGHSALCHELAHLVLARDGDSDGDHSARDVWQDRSGPASLEYACWNWVLASPGLNLVME